MLPVLKFYADEENHHTNEATKAMCVHFNLSEKEKNELLPSETQPKIDNRTSWARHYMIRAGLLEKSGRGYAKITKRGKDVLSKNPNEINIKFLNQFPEFLEFKNKGEKQKEKKDIKSIEEMTPDEMMDAGFAQMKENLMQDLMKKIMESNPYFFEEIVLKLLEAMGYGIGNVTKRSGDGGVDGIVNRDKLGLEKIYFQTKRFAENNNVSAGMVRDFLGTLDYNAIQNGVFITTSQFSKEAGKIAEKTHKSIVLVDGYRLAELMIQNNVGVSVQKKYEIKKIDNDFFDES